jgi:hypothetical protein
MITLLLLAAIGQSKCVGPDCPAPQTQLIQSVASPDTETIQRIWVTNQNRYAYGVIRNGYFVEATQANQSSTGQPATPDDPGSLANSPGSLTGLLTGSLPASPISAGTIGSPPGEPNYGINLAELKNPAFQGFYTNVGPDGFNPAEHGPPPTLPSDPTPRQRAEWVVPILFGTTAVLMFFGVLLMGLAAFNKPRQQGLAS